MALKMVFSYSGIIERPPNWESNNPDLSPTSAPHQLCNQGQVTLIFLVLLASLYISNSDNICHTGLGEWLYVSTWRVEIGATQLLLQKFIQISYYGNVCQCRRQNRCGFDPWVRKIPWRRKWKPTSVFLIGKSHGQRDLVGYSACGC